MSKRALILVDYQNEGVNKTSPYYISELNNFFEQTNKLINFCRKQGDKIIFIRHIEENSDSVFINGNKNSEIVSVLHKNPSDIVITKTKISPFYKTTLENELHGINKIIVCGILTNLCVRSIIHDAYDRDFIITVIKNFCTTYDKVTHDFTLKDVKETRPEVEFQDLEEFISI